MRVADLGRLRSLWPPAAVNRNDQAGVQFVLELIGIGYGSSRVVGEQR